MDIKQSLQQAITHYQAGQLEDAERIFNEILQIAPKHPDANHNLGVLHKQSNQLESALYLFRTALEANPHQDQFWISCIDVLIDLGQMDAAQTVLEQGQIQGLQGDAVVQLENRLSPKLGFSFNASLATRSESIENQSALTPSQIDSVVSLHSSGQKQEALDALKLLISQYPEEAVLYNMMGVCFASLNDLDNAVESYQQALIIEPNYAEGHYNLGGTLKNLNQLDGSVKSYERALTINPDFAEAYNNLGIVLNKLGKHNEAIENYNRALIIQPNYAEAHYNLGTSLADSGQLEPAMASYKQAIEINPHYAEAYCNLGVIYKELGKLELAIDSYKNAIQLKSEFTDAHNNLGIVFQILNQLDEAVECFEKALIINPNYAEAHSNLGIIYHDMGELDAAVRCHEQALKIKPDFAEAHSNLGIVLRDLDQFDKAIKCHKKALKIKPNYAEAYTNLGVVFHDTGQLDLATKNHSLAVNIKPNFAKAHSNLGIALHDLGQYDAAIKCYEEALKLKPNFAEFKWNLSLTQLITNNLTEGWINYESRWQWDNFPSCRRRFSIPRWSGESLQGKNILLWAEQGIGDEIQFASLIPEFKDLGCNVGIECAAKLVNVFHWSFPWAEVSKTGMINCEEIDIYSQFDYQIPMGSIAPFFRKTLDDFRTYQNPYIPRLKEGEIKVRNKLNLVDGQLLIGLCWRSSIQTEQRSHHYLTIEELAPLKTIKNAIFLAVQYDDCLPELDRVRELGLPIRYYTNIDQKNDLSSTCALIGACDLVISASTTVFQMSGALGVPVIVFHAGKSNENKIPWFPTVRNFPLSLNDPSLLITNIINQMPKLITWVNKVTTSKRQVDY